MPFGRLRASIQDRPRVHDALRIQRGFYVADRVEPGVAAVESQVAPFQPADAVFGADRAIELASRVVNRVAHQVDHFRLCMEEGALGNAIGREHVVVDVAVADVAVAVNPEPGMDGGDLRVGDGNEVVNAAQRDRGVAVAKRAGQAVGFGHTLAQAPKILIMVPIDC